jgi:hypothetical protein
MFSSEKDTVNNKNKLYINLINPLIRVKYHKMILKIYINNNRNIINKAED